MLRIIATAIFVSGLLSALLTRCHAIYDDVSDSSVVVLSSEDFQEKVLASRDAWVVEFYDPLNENCIMMAPAFEEIAKDLKNYGILFGAVDATAHQKIVTGESIPPAYPAIKYYVDAGERNPYTGAPWRRGDLFPGGTSTADALRQTVLGKIPESAVHEVSTAEEYDTFVAAAADRGLGRVVLYSDLKYPLIMLAAHKYAGRVATAVVDLSAEAVMARHGLSLAADVPAVVAHRAGEGDRGRAAAVWRGKGRLPEEAVDWAKLDRLFARVAAKEEERKEAAAAGGGDGGAGAGAGGQEGGGKGGAGGGQPFPAAGAAELRAAEEEGAVLGDAAAWVVLRLAEGQAPEGAVGAADWAKLSKKFEGLVRGAVVRCPPPGAAAAAAAAAAEGPCAEELPHLEVFPYAADPALKRAGAARFPAGKLQKALDRAAASLPNLVHVITPDMLMAGGPPGQDGFARAMNHAVVNDLVPLIVASRKPEPSGTVKSIAVEFEGAASVILLADPPEGVLASLPGLRMPGLAVMMAQGETAIEGSDQVEVRMGLTPYPAKEFGGFSYEGIQTFLASVLMQSRPEKLQEVLRRKEERAAGGGGGSSSSSSPSAPRAPKELREATAENWEEVCPQASSVLCVITFLDGYQSEEETEAQLAIMRAVLAKEDTQDGPGTPFEFSYVKGTCDPAFAAAFDVDPAMHLPAAVAYSPRKARFARHVGTFSESAVRDFLRGVLSSRIRTGPLFAEGAPAPSADTQCEEGFAGLSEGAAGGEDAGDVDEFMAEILAEEARERERRARELREEQEAQKAMEEAERKAEQAAATKKKKKKKKKKKNTEL